MSMSSQPSLHLNSPQTSSSDSIKFPDFFFCLFCGWVRGLGLDRPRQRQEVFQKNLFGDMFLLAWLLFLFTLCSDVLYPPTNSLSKVSFNFFFFHNPTHWFVLSVCLFTYFPLSILSDLTFFSFLCYFSSRILLPLFAHHIPSPGICSGISQQDNESRSFWLSVKAPFLCYKWGGKTHL